MKVMKEAEFILPDGRTATFKSPSFGNWWFAHMGPSEMFFPRLLSVCVEIDGKKLKAEEWLELDFEDISPAVQHVLAFLNRVEKSGLGVA